FLRPRTTVVASLVCRRRNSRAVSVIACLATQPMSKSPSGPVTRPSSDIDTLATARRPLSLLFMSSFPVLNEDESLTRLERRSQFPRRESLAVLRGCPIVQPDRTGLAYRSQRCGAGPVVGTKACV